MLIKLPDLGFQLYLDPSYFAFNKNNGKKPVRELRRQLKDPRGFNSISFF